MRLPETLHIELLSETTCGRGEGTAGLVDVEIEHEACGLPFIGGRTLRGLLRDTWMSMAGCFPWLDPAAERVLGRSGSLAETTALRIGDAHLPAPIRRAAMAAVRRRENPLAAAEILGACSEIRWRTAEDRATGAAAGRSLRATRVAHRGLTFIAPLTWMAADPPGRDDLALLALTALSARHLGLGRNRGSGHVRCTFEGDPEWTRRAARAADRGGGAAVTVFLTYSLTLRAPAVSTTFGGDPNSAVTAPFIPGGKIRGAVAARLLAAGHGADETIFRTIVLSGAVRFLHAYPVVEGERSVPTPASWRVEKLDSTRLYDLADYAGLAPDDDLDQLDDLGDRWPESILAPPPGPFVALRSLSRRPLFHTPHRHARMHHQRDRVKGRAWRQLVRGVKVPRGNLFTYEYLEAGQVFRGLIQVDTARIEAGAAVAGRLRELLDGRPVSIGRSRTAGYGGDGLFCFDPGEVDREVATGAAALAGDLAAGETLRLILLSAYIGRDERTGQIDPGALLGELARRGVAVDLERRRWSFEIIDGFNRAWGLPLPRVRAAAGGSVFVLRARRPLSAALLRQVEAEGLGERRIDGFGRLLFLRHRTAPDAVGGDRSVAVAQRSEAAGRLEIESSGDELREEEAKVFAFIERRILLRTARRELDLLALELAAEARDVPSRSLLGRLRTLFRPVVDRTSARKALAGLRRWLGGSRDEGALADDALSKLKTCRVSETAFHRWLERIGAIETKPDPWRALSAALGEPPSLGAIPDAKYLTTPEAATEHLRHEAPLLAVELIDGVLAALARRREAVR